MKKYGLIGRSLSHSFSKGFFTTYFQQNGIASSYSNLELTRVDEFPRVKELYDGFNVTIPYKEEIINYLDELDPIAKVIGAVNTIKVSNGVYKGFNTDVIGFANMIKPFLTNKHEKALILGTGGASKAVVFVLEGLGVECLLVSSSGKGDFAYSDINGVMIESCKLIVNTTPVGMYPDISARIDLPYSNIGEEHLVIDLIYNPEETILLKEAKLQGAAVLNGLSMLKEQALASYRIWNE